MDNKETSHGSSISLPHRPKPMPNPNQMYGDGQYLGENGLDYQIRVNVPDVLGGIDSFIQSKKVSLGTVRLEQNQARGFEEIYDEYLFWSRPLLRPFPWVERIVSLDAREMELTMMLRWRQLGRKALLGKIEKLEVVELHLMAKEIQFRGMRQQALSLISKIAAETESEEQMSYHQFVANFIAPYDQVYLSWVQGLAESPWFQKSNNIILFASIVGALMASFLVWYHFLRTIY